MTKTADSLIQRPECSATGITGEDVLSSIMSAVHLETGCIARNVLREPWGIEFEGPPLAAFLGQDQRRFAIFHTIGRGSAWLRSGSGSAAIPLNAGDVVVYLKADTHVLSGSPDGMARPLAEIIAQFQAEQSFDGIFGEGTGPETSMLCGYFTYDRDGAHPLFSTLPDVIHIRREDARSEWLTHTLDFMAAESSSDQPGRGALLAGLTRLLFIQIVRCVIEHERQSTGWLAAMRDPSVSGALSAIHQDHRIDWTVESLASVANMSRSVFARKFSSLVGEPPLQYLTRWRIQKASEDLGSGVYSLTEVAERAGYGSEAAFSRAFKRWVGTTPGTYRRSAA